MVYSADRSTQKDTSSSAVTSSLSDLIARLEKATGDSRTLDAMIHHLVRDGIGNGAYSHAPQYTSSIDAAMTLVPEGHHFGLDTAAADEVYSFASIMLNGVAIGRPANHAGRTPAIALCIAALRARSLPAI